MCEVQIAIISALLCIHAQCFLIEEHWVPLHQSMAGIGDVLIHIPDTSMIQCGQECSTRTLCTGGIFSPSNMSCTLLYVEDVMDDWEKTDDDIIYMCMDCVPGPEGL